VLDQGGVQLSVNSSTDGAKHELGTELPAATGNWNLVVIGTAAAVGLFLCVVMSISVALLVKLSFLWRRYQDLEKKLDQSFSRSHLETFRSQSENFTSRLETSASHLHRSALQLGSSTSRLLNSTARLEGYTSQLESSVSHFEISLPVAHSTLPRRTGQSKSEGFRSPRKVGSLV